jgi:hypothetical protein
VLVELFSPDQELLVGSGQNLTSIMPVASPLFGFSDAALAYIAPETGTYVLGLSASASITSYAAEINLYRSTFESEDSGTRQILFLDFNGATIDAAELFVFGNDSAVLSPLSEFLSGWGLNSGDQNAVIDAIIAEVTENLRTDLAAFGNNSRFNISIRNSRDHADPFGQANVSRVIIGGTMDELGIDTIGIAESIDPGNFARKETAVVLLDLLSASAANPNSLNGFALDPGATKIELIGVGVGNIVAHEAGHFFANFHTDQSNDDANIMDQGGNLPNTIGVGADMIFGTSDDSDVDFIADVYANEGFTGTEDTLNLTAFGLGSGAGAGSASNNGGSNSSGGGGGGGGLDWWFLMLLLGALPKLRARHS